MSTVMTRGICWALAALQVSPENTNRHILGETNETNLKSISIPLDKKNDNHAKKPGELYDAHHNKHYKHQDRNHHHHHEEPTSTTSTTSSILAGVVDAVLSLADVSGSDVISSLAKGDTTSTTTGSSVAKEDSENVQPTFSRDEVADHCSDNSCWIIINNRVYDVTKFLRMHPGGEDIILEYGGHDATCAFIEKGHSLDAFSMLHDYCIGIVTKAEWYPEKNHT